MTNDDPVRANVLDGAIASALSRTTCRPHSRPSRACCSLEQNGTFLSRGAFRTHITPRVAYEDCSNRSFDGERAAKVIRRDRAGRLASDGRAGGSGTPSDV